AGPLAAAIYTMVGANPCSSVSVEQGPCGANPCAEAVTGTPAPGQVTVLAPAPTRTGPPATTAKGPATTSAPGGRATPSAASTQGNHRRPVFTYLALGTIAVVVIGLLAAPHRTKQPHMSRG
ncbi:MAG: hypothetical protein M3326_14135, partial [Actinomycetota bacterium]|nr:hypothetical protein [Actinomycetota bacterium]